MSFGSPADVNGTLYFAGVARSDGLPLGLWRSDGTAAGTTIVKDSLDLGLLHDLTDVNGTLYFIGDTSPRLWHCRDRELWRSDGTEAGTTMVKDFGTGPPATSPTSTAPSTSSSPDGVHPNELWRSDGTEAGTTLVKRTSAIALTSPSSRGIIYFSAGGGLWRSDGTPQGTILVKGRLRPTPSH